VRQVQVQHQRLEGYSGPLPHPEHFAQFNAILPGAAERMMKMAEDQSLHRRQMEHREQVLEHLYGGAGLLCAFLICTAAIAGSVVCILHDRNVGGTLLGGAGLAAVVGMLIAGRRSAKRK
jgi:uncharacterized membrane protein